MSAAKIRISCRKNPNGVRPDTFFAVIWGAPDRAKYDHGGPPMLARGEGSTRAAAISAAKLSLRTEAPLEQRINP